MQNYENYWKITRAFTDINGEKYIENLRAIKIFIDKNKKSILNSNNEEKQNLYKNLQLNFIPNYLKKNNISPITDVSTRKAINQFIKEGFIESNLNGYDSRVDSFLNAKNNEQRRFIFSQVVWKSFSSKRSFSKSSETNELKFLVNTIDNHPDRFINLKELIGLMNSDPEDYPRGYLTFNELVNISNYVQKVRFKDRKYNQISHFLSLLNNVSLVNISGSGDRSLITLDEYTDKPNFFIERDKEAKNKKRDPYLQHLYRKSLQNESLSFFGKDNYCMVERIPFDAHKGLVASHIKPFRYSNDLEEYDLNNGLLLNSYLDNLFDSGHISFSNTGRILCSDHIDKNLSKRLEHLYLDTVFINDERIGYLKYHRENIFISESGRDKRKNL